MHNYHNKQQPYALLRFYYAMHMHSEVHAPGLKKVPPLACYNFDTCERIWIILCRNVTDKVGNQKTLYCATSNNLCFCTTWQNKETKNCIFQLKCYISALPEFNQLLHFFNLFDSRYSRLCTTS